MRHDRLVKRLGVKSDPVRRGSKRPFSQTNDSAEKSNSNAPKRISTKRFKSAVSTRGSRREEAQIFIRKRGLWKRMSLASAAPMIEFEMQPKKYLPMSSRAQAFSFSRGLISLQTFSATILCPSGVG